MTESKDDKLTREQDRESVLPPHAHADFFEAETLEHVDGTDDHSLDSPEEETIVRLPLELGRYRVMKRLGQGGFGTVYLGNDDQLDRKVAIKIPRRGVSKTKADEFLREAQRLAKLRHPGIVTVYDVCHDAQSCFIVTEFIEGRSLFDVLAKEALNWEKAADIIAHIADALAHAHANGMIHRDIKPSNIILRPDGSPIVLDFGLALTDLEAVGPDGYLRGTPAYMAPEQARGQAHRVDGRTDIFSLGVVLYEMLTGRRAFRADNIEETLRRVVEDDPQPVRQLAATIPPEVAAACETAMAKQMEHRFTTAGDFAVTLRAGVAGTTASMNGPYSEIGSVVTSASAVLPALSGTHAQPREVRSRAGRRHVTIAMFNFEPISPDGPVDAEDQHEISRLFGRLVAESVDEFGGTVIPTAGQEVMACFGYPTAYEHAAHRAVRAALLLRGAVESAWGSDQEKRFGCQLSIWSVVHSGDVVVEESQSERSGMSLTGAACNVVAHLETVAEPNTVSISDSTYRLVEGFFVCNPLPPQRVRGVAEPIPLFRVLNETRKSNRVDVVARENLSELVGRDTELSILKDRWEQALEGLGQVVLLIGDAGLGKSRLIREISEYVSSEHEDEALAVVEMRCSPYYQATGFFPVIQFFEKFLDFEQLDPAERLSRIVDHLAELQLDSPENAFVFASLLSVPLGGRYADLQLTPQRVKESTAELLLAWLASFSRRQPVLFVVEDLHWIDPSTLEVLSRHVERNETVQALTLLTFRPEFETPWRSLAHQTQIALNRLTKRQITRMLRERLDRDKLPEMIVSQIIARTEGVPLFIEEYAKLVEESDLLEDTADATESLVLKVIPETLLDLLMTRLDRMASNPQVVQMAATIGREFSHEMIKAAAGLDDRTLEWELAKLTEAEIIFRKGTSSSATFMFKHALIQDAAYDSLLKKMRQENHGIIAAVLEEQFPQTADKEPELLAHHFTEAGQSLKGTGYWLNAGQRAQVRSANAEAISHLTRGLEILRTLDETPERDELELGLQTTLGPVLMAARGWSAPEVGVAIERAQELCSKIGTLEDQFFVMWGLWGWRVIRADLDICDGIAEDIMRLVNASADGQELLAEAYWVPGCTAYYKGEFKTALEQLEKGLALVQSGPERAHSLKTGQYCSVMHRNHLALALWELGFPDQALQRADEMLELARELEHPFSLAMALHFRRRLLQCCGREHRARHSIEEEYRLCHEQGFIFFEVHAVFARGVFLLQGRKIDAARDLLAQGLQMLQATGGKLSMDHPYGCIAEAFLSAGMPNDANEWLARGFDLVHNHNYRAMESEFLRLKGELARADENEAEAEVLFQKAAQVARKQQSKSRELRAIISLGRLRQSQGRRAEGRQILGDAYSRFGEGLGTADLVAAKTLLDELRA